MLTIKNYVKVQSLQEAYELNQKRSARVLGGTLWLKMGKRTVQTAIDLSDLGLDQVEETEEEFKIGAMTTLRQIETHEGLNAYTAGAVRECVRHIVGTQFRNCATVGGSIYGRFGFSDVLTCFLAMDAFVELYPTGIVPLAEFVNQNYGNEILVSLIVRKKPMLIGYETLRNEATDFPVVAVAVAKWDDMYHISVGARPARAALQVTPCIEDYEKEAAKFTYGSNMRASKEYRQYLAGVLMKRICEGMEEK
ncbi:MAG: FAD binding domain-containing protein [Lachnospiraceae bacterium]